MGIANIINTAGGGGGGGSEIITNLVNSVDGAGLRLANQGYISCADVSANRLGTSDFSVEFVLSQETNAVNADIFISNLNGSNQAVDAAVIRWDVVQNDNIQLVFTNSSAAETAYNFGYDPAPDLNEPTHYLVSADRSGNAVLYRNGAEIASVSIAASGSANVGNSGQPTVIGSPVNNFGVKGNVYRLRTYSKALSSDEAKNVFDRADVPTALVSNLLLDLDCAYANPTQSTVIQDRGPNNQDGTLNGTITQTNVIKQLNSTSARIGTSAGTPADRELLLDKFLTFSDNGGTITSANTTGEITIAGGNATNNGGNISLRGGSHGTPNTIRARIGGTTAMTIDSTGAVTFTSDATSDQFLVTNADATSTSAPDLVLYRNSATPADSDNLGLIQFRGKNSTDQTVNYGSILGSVTDISDTSEDSKLTFYTYKAGTETPTLTLESGIGNFNEGLTIAGANNWSHITSSNDQSLSLADDAQIQLAGVRAGAMLIHIYEQSAGHGAVIFATYFGQPELIAGSSTYFDVADTDGKICVIKSSSSHDVYLKNRRGSSKNFNVLVTAAVIDNF